MSCMVNAILFLRGVRHGHKRSAKGTLTLNPSKTYKVLIAEFFENAGSSAVGSIETGSSETLNIEKSRVLWFKNAQYLGSRTRFVVVKDVSGTIVEAWYRDRENWKWKPLIF